MNAPAGLTAATDLAPIAPETIVLPGGTCAVLCFDGLDTPLPDKGTITEGDGAEWTAVFWPRNDRFAGVAIVAASTFGNFGLTDDQGNAAAQIALPTTMTTDVDALVTHLKAGACPMAEVLHALSPRLPEPFKTNLLQATSHADGFIEVLIRPECGGLVLQGWAHTNLSGSLTLMGAAEGLDALSAAFERDDILAPAAGFCMFVKDWAGHLENSKALFIDHGGRFLRLDILPSWADPITGPGSTAHMRAMLPRLHASPDITEGFKRIVRPRFDGKNTMAGHDGPVTAAIDRILRTPSGGLYVTGWLLDPLDQVDRAILKSTGNLYAPLHTGWHRTERPDLNDAFGPDPRFAGLLDPREKLHGFSCAVLADPEELDGADIYLELVLKDDRCLFLPCSLTPCDGPGAAHPVLATLHAHDPALDTLITRHAAPFLATVPERMPSRSKWSVKPLGGGPAGKPVAALVPVRDAAHLQPVLAGLADTPDAQRLDLIVIVDRSNARDVIDELDGLFRFFGLTGALVLVPDHDTLADRLDAGLSLARAPKILVWQTTVLPKASGWLATLLKTAHHADGPAVTAPLLTYEDGSVYFGGGSETAPIGAACAMVGFERHRIASDDPRPAQILPAEIALIDRKLLQECGGFRGGLWGDRFIGHDLSQRLSEKGAGVLCVPGAEFWMLDSAGPDQSPGSRSLTDRIDAELIALRHTTQMNGAQP